MSREEEYWVSCSRGKEGPLSLVGLCGFASRLPGTPAAIGWLFSAVAFREGFPMCEVLGSFQLRADFLLFHGRVVLHRRLGHRAWALAGLPHLASRPSVSVGPAPGACVLEILCMEMTVSWW